jgi:hypothetical protein
MGENQSNSNFLHIKVKIIIEALVKLCKPDNHPCHFLFLRTSGAEWLLFLDFEVRRKSFSVRPEITFQKERWVRA